MPDHPSSPYVLWFDDYHDVDHPRVGGKNASLGSMIRAGLPVPPGFAVTTDAYRTLRTQPGLRDEVRDRLSRVDWRDAAGLREISAEVRGLIEKIELPDDIVDAVGEAYEALCSWCEVDGLPVAVRSSATAEDLPDASFAGLQDTFLWVQGVGSVLEHVRRCWSSVFTDRAVAYRHERGFTDEVIDMSVGVQKMVEPVAAGVAFTLNPSTGDRSQVAIDASWGFGEAVVSGEVTPDNFLVDKVIGEIVQRKISPKSIAYELRDQRVEVVEVPTDRAEAPCLTDEQIKAIAAMARRAERHYGRPQDVEWALDRHLPEGDNVILLQSRPETVWSNKPRQPVSRGPSGMDAIVATLLSPMHARATETEGAAG